MKRFTETLKWQDPWFRRLSSGAKMLWIYMTDHCDNTGLVEVDFTLASLDTGMEVNGKHAEELGDRVQRVTDVKFFIPKFIQFQFGELSEACKAHTKIIQTIKSVGIERDTIGYRYPKGRVRVPTKTGRGIGKEEEGGCKGEPKPEEEVLGFLNEAAGRSYRGTDVNLTLIRCRLEEVRGDVAGVKAMISRQTAKWKTDPKMSEFLRPETLFCKSKFGAYYDNRNLPVDGSAKPAPPAGETDEQRKARIKQELHQMTIDAMQ